MSFEESIKSWVQIDNKIKTINEQLKQLRTQKNTLNSTIFDYANKH